MSDPWIALPAGAAIATVAVSIGIGGGILWMPFFLLGLGLDPGTAVVSSLLIQVAGMGSGSFAFFREKAVDLRLMSFLLMATLPGVGIGAWISRVVQPPHMELLLGLFALTTAFWFVNTSQKYEEKGSSRADMAVAYRYGWRVTLMSVGSGLLSVSIGEWLIPLLRSRFQLRMRTAIATSIATIFGVCIIGVVFHLAMGNRIDWEVVGFAVPGVLLGGQIGPRITKSIEERKLKEVFIFALTLIGIHLIYNAV